MAARTSLWLRQGERQFWMAVEQDLAEMRRGLVPHSWQMSQDDQDSLALCQRIITGDCSPEDIGMAFEATAFNAWQEDEGESLKDFIARMMWLCDQRLPRSSATSLFGG
jgi:hypothetical protein